MTPGVSVVDPTLVVLAAGMGSRYGGLKQLDPVGPSGEILLDYSVGDAMAAGFKKTVFVIRREMLDAFRDLVGRRYEEKIAVEYAFQELEPLPGGRVSPPGRTKPWGTGQAVLSTGSLVREPFVVINADDYYGSGGFSELARFLGSGNPGTGHYAMVGFRLDQTLSEHGTVSRGICRADARGYLLDITERTAIARLPDRIVDRDHPSAELSGAEWASMNFWGFTPDLFPRLEEQFDSFLALEGDSPRAEFYLPAAVSSLISSGNARVRLLHSSDPWFGLTHPEDRAQMVRFLAGISGSQ